jgi:hypothetical protein
MTDAIRSKRQLAPAACRPFPLVSQPSEMRIQKSGSRIASPNKFAESTASNQAGSAPDFSGRGNDQTVIAACPRLPTNRGTPGTIAASPSVTEPQHCRRGTSPGIRRTWLVVAVPAPPESAAIPVIPC